MSSPDIVILGHVIDETICFPDRTVTSVLGSPAACAAVIASKLGGRVGLVTRFGTDFPPEMLSVLSRAGIDMRGALQEGPHSTRNRLIYDELGKKRLVYQSKAPPISFSDIPRDYLRARLFLSCPMDHEVPLRTLAELHAAGAVVAVDLGGYGGATSAQPGIPAAGLSELRALLGYTRIAKASAEDCLHLFGSQAEPAASVRTLVKLGAAIGIVTAAQHGAYVATAHEVKRIPAFASAVADVTGAGDAFSAGFIVDYLRGGGLEQAVRFGCATAAVVIESSGGVSGERMPAPHVVRARLASQREAQDALTD